MNKKAKVDEIPSIAVYNDRGLESDIKNGMKLHFGECDASKYHLCLLKDELDEKRVYSVPVDQQISDLQRTRYYFVAIYSARVFKVFLCGFLDAISLSFSVRDCQKKMVDFEQQDLLRVRCTPQEVETMARRYYSQLTALNFRVRYCYTYLVAKEEEDEQVDWVALVKYESGYAIMSGIIRVSLLPTTSDRALRLALSFPYTDYERARLFEWVLGSGATPFPQERYQYRGSATDSRLCRMINPFPDNPHIWRSFCAYTSKMKGFSISGNTIGSSVWWDKASERFDFTAWRRPSKDCPPHDFAEWLLRDRIEWLMAPDPDQLKQDRYAMLHSLPALWADETSFFLLRELVLDPAHSEAREKVEKRLRSTWMANWGKYRSLAQIWVMAEKRLLKIRYEHWGRPVSLLLKMLGLECEYEPDEVDEDEELADYFKRLATLSEEQCGGIDLCSEFFPKGDDTKRVFKLPFEKCLPLINRKHGPQSWILQNGFVTFEESKLELLAFSDFDPERGYEFKDFFRYYPLFQNTPHQETPSVLTQAAIKEGIKKYYPGQDETKYRVCVLKTYFDQTLTYKIPKEVAESVGQADYYFVAIHSVEQQKVFLCGFLDTSLVPQNGKDTPAFHIKSCRQQITPGYPELVHSKIVSKLWTTKPEVFGASPPSSSSSSVKVPVITDEKQLDLVLPPCVKKMHEPATHLNNKARWVYAMNMFDVGWTPNMLVTHKAKDFAKNYHSSKIKSIEKDWEVTLEKKREKGMMCYNCSSMIREGLCPFKTVFECDAKKYGTPSPGNYIRGKVHELKIGDPRIKVSYESSSSSSSSQSSK